ncbi:SEL1-like repeat protein, partial [Helicobacter pylori]
AEPTPKELFDLGVKSNKAKDYIKAKKYFEKACGLKDGDGCLRLGEMQRSGEGVVKNREQAMKNFKKGCDLKNKLACMGYIATVGEIMNERCQLGDEVACVRLNNLLDDIGY